jgi:uncharacterized protein (TIGR00661 family)
MKKRILIAPLNWGLGHATRCIPVINTLLKYDFEPILASDGNALAFLKNEFPKLEYIELPSYNITYPKKVSFKWHFLKKVPNILNAIKKEQKVITSLIDSKEIDGIISDNRFGVFSNKVPSVYITHQLNVLSGNTSWLSSKIHRKTIHKFDECWVPDAINSSLSGELSNSKDIKTKVKYIGALSRLKKQTLDLEYDLLVLLSGPEPQRSLLESLLLEQLNNFKGSVAFVRGEIEKKQTKVINGKMVIFNYLNSHELNTVINKSALVLSRSGYSTIMDLAKLEKKAFFVPTPGQYEQEFLAKHLKNKNIAPFSSQKDFNIESLKTVKNYTGFEEITFEELPKHLFSLFEGK